MVEQSLKDKTVKGTFWSGIDNIVQFGITFAVSVVLARLLTPEDYGLIGIVGIFTTICGAIVNGGFETALIRTKNATEEDYSTAFICNLGVSIALYAIIFIGAPVIADYFQRHELSLLIRVASLSIIVSAFSIVQQTKIIKRIDFKSQTKVTLIASVLSGIVGIGLALMEYGVWALVAQLLVLSAMRTILLCLINKWIPSLRFSLSSFHSLFGFGWKIMTSKLLEAIWKELYQVVVGKYYSPAALGQYTRAKQFSTLFSQNLTTVIQRVTYPVLSNIQDNHNRMLLAYRRIIKVTMFVTLISMFFIAAVSEPLLYCLIGPKWHDAAMYLPLICFNGALYPLHAINLNMLQVQGRSDLYLGLEIIKKVIALGPLFIGAFVGIMEMLWVSLFVGIISYFLNSYYSGKLMDYNSWKQIKDITISFVIASSVAIFVYTLKFLPVSYWIVLPLQVVFGAITCFFVCELTKTEEYIEVKSIVISFYKKVHDIKHS